MPKVFRYRDGLWDEANKPVIAELSVSLSVNNEYWLTFMCTPIDLEALGVGFLFNENIIQTKDDIASVRQCRRGGGIDIWLNYVVKKPEKWTRTSGCSGGKTSIEYISTPGLAAIPANGFMLSPDKIARLIDAFTGVQELYKRTGGVHTSAWSDGERIIVAAEDIGRHNTLDKLAGKALLTPIHPQARIILTTGRVSAEMIQKSIRMGASMVISRTSPTSLSVAMAERSGITLIGYARGQHFSVYTHPERVQTITAGLKTKREVV